MPAAMSSDTAPSPTGSSAGPLLGLDGEPLRIGVLTSGGDAQGMNAAVRAGTDERVEPILGPQADDVAALTSNNKG